LPSDYRQLPRRRVRVGLLAIALMVGGAVGVWRAIELGRPEAPTEFEYAVRVLDADEGRLEVVLLVRNLEPGAIELGSSANAVA
jgi:hypothetical protein